jgi:HPt (histidine-containing phosphotransfer) domain-containing protein
MPSSNSNQGYSNNYSQVSSEITDQQLLDNGVSETSLEVIEHFGADAPAILNEYACQIEDSLITTNNQLQEAVSLLQEMSEEHKAYEQILTDPDVLADYTCEFFGPEGPYPVDEEEPAYGYQQAPQAPTFAGQQIQAQAPVRPDMPVPPSPQAPSDPEDFWGDFGDAADRDPQNAWRYLNAAQQNPEVFRQKLLVME